MPFDNTTHAMQQTVGQRIFGIGRVGFDELVGLTEEVFALVVRPDAGVTAEPLELPPTGVGELGWVVPEVFDVVQVV